MQSEEKMKALSRRPDLGPRKEMTLADGTKIEEIPILVEAQRNLQKNKKLDDDDRGYHLLALRIRVDGQSVVYDDLMKCFTTDELEEIMKFVFPEEVAAAEKAMESNERQPSKND